jgi:uncharacterized iron-regulated protein
MMTPLLLLAQVATATPADPTHAASMPVGHPGIGAISTWTPHRVYDAEHRRWSDLESLAAAAAQHDVVFFGEQHDDPGTHAMQRALLEAISRRRPVVLSLEMFERDVQPVVDGYLAGRIPEDSLLAGGRPWPRYASDYRPAVEWARAHAWPVIAANVPRPIASAISRGGLAMLDTLGERRALAAAEIFCPHNEYFTRFTQTMEGHVPGDTEEAKAAAIERYYQSQCVKDETMAESIVQARADAGPVPLVVHLNGAFHSNYGLGTTERVERRLPDARLLVITAIPVASLDGIAPSGEQRKQGEWLVYTLRAAAVDSTGAP